MPDKKPPGIPLSALKQHLSKGKIAPVYIIAGDENFLAAEAVRAIAESIETHRGQPSRSFYHGDQVSLATVLDDARTLNLFSPARLVTVSPADRFVEKHKNSLAAYASAKTPPGACLVLVVTKADGRHKLTKIVQDAGALVTCGRVYERDVPTWIVARTKAMSRQIDQDAVALLVDFFGTDLASLASELEKLAAYIGDRKNINADDVEAASLRHRARDVFQLADAIGLRRPPHAIKVLDALLEQGEKPGKIIFMVSKHIRRLWTAKDLIRKGIQPNDAAQTVGVRPFFHGQFLAQVQLFTFTELRTNSSALLHCEASHKSSEVADENKRILLETTFIRLASPRPNTAPKTRATT